MKIRCRIRTCAQVNCKGMFPRQEIPGKVYNEASHGNPDCQEEAPEVIIDRSWVLKPKDHDIPTENRKIAVQAEISSTFSAQSWIFVNSNTSTNLSRFPKTT